MIMNSCVWKDMFVSDGYDTTKLKLIWGDPPITIASKNIKFPQFNLTSYSTLNCDSYYYGSTSQSSSSYYLLH